MLQSVLGRIVPPGHVTTIWWVLGPGRMPPGHVSTKQGPERVRPRLEPVAFVPSEQVMTTHGRAKGSRFADACLPGTSNEKPAGVVPHRPEAAT